MIGDKLQITEYHRKGALLIVEEIKRSELQIPYSVVVSGESGCGKSEIAQCLKDHLESAGLEVFILGQDDYFKLPPHSNHKKRLSDISWVGPNEVKLDLLNSHIKSLLEKGNHSMIKPLVNFEQNSIGTETISGSFDVVIAEGTYTSLLENVTLRAFIDRNYKETKKDRLSRNRDQALDGGKDKALSFLRDVLEIEHQIIKKHKALADVVIPKKSELLQE